MHECECGKKVISKSYLHCTYRIDAEGEIGKQFFYCPVALPRLPGRFYFFFGEPISTQGKPCFCQRLQSASTIEILHAPIHPDFTLTLVFRYRKEGCINRQRQSSGALFRGEDGDGEMHRIFEGKKRKGSI